MYIGGEDMKKNNEKKRLNMNIPSNLLSAIDDYADSMSLSRTSAIIVLVNTALEQKNTIDVMQELLQEIKEEV